MEESSIKLRTIILRQTVGQCVHTKGMIMQLMYLLVINEQFRNIHLNY